MADCLSRDEAPFASHGLYTQPGVLDDTKPKEREKGMRAGFAWTSLTSYRGDAKCVVYADLGISPGMEEGIAHANDCRMKIEFRRLGGEWAK